MQLGERFWSKVDTDGECWLWTASKGHFGHGQFYLAGAMKRAHRLAYEELVGAIPEGMHLDHLCENPPCVNPAHLEPVSPKENTLRGTNNCAAKNARVRYCPRGHPYDAANTYRAGVKKRPRRCLICHREQSKKSMRKQREKRKANVG